MSYKIWHAWKRKHSYVIRLNSGVFQKEFLNYKNVSSCVHTRMCHDHNIAQSCRNGWCPEHQMSVEVTHFKTSQASFLQNHVGTWGLHEGNVSRLCFQLSLWPLSKSFPLFQLPLMSFYFSSLSVFIFYLVFRGSKSKFTSPWQMNPFSGNVRTTPISVGSFVVLLVSLDQASTALHLR